MDIVDVDKAAVESQFRANLTEYVIADINGTASPRISAKLRSQEYIKEWGMKLSELSNKPASRSIKQKINAFRMEAATLRTQYHKISDGDVTPLKEFIKAEVGVDVGNQTTHGISIILLTEILKELRKQ